MHKCSLMANVLFHELRETAGSLLRKQGPECFVVISPKLGRENPLER